MRKHLTLIVSLCFLVLGSQAHAQNACSTVSCDCTNLPVDSWKSICIEKEKRIAASCSAANEFKPQGYCSIHGPLANRLPLSISLESEGAVAKEDIVRLNYKIAILYWSLHKDLDMLQDKVNNNTWDKAQHYVDLIDLNADHLFTQQKRVVESYAASNDEALAEKSWRDYSEDTLKVGNMLYDYGKAMLNAAEAQESEALKVDTHKLAFKLLQISGRMHEQAGYAYANGVRHSLASKTWKQAADISDMILKSEKNRVDANFYREQRAMRLHKASYYWVVGQGENETSISDAEQLIKESDKNEGVEL